MQMASSGTVEIQMPQMGESVTEGTVLEWHKREGEFVEEGETVVEVSTDKIDAEVPAPASGTITKIVKGEDETIEVEVPAPASGTITKILVQPDETVQVGQPLAEMAVGAARAPGPKGRERPPEQESATAARPGAEAAAERAPEQEPATAAPVDAEGADGKRASPVARRIAAASGIDLSSVKGSGPGGKVIKADVLAAANGEPGAPTAAPAPAAEAGEAKPLRGPAGMLVEAMNESR